MLRKTFKTIHFKAQISAVFGKSFTFDKIIYLCTGFIRFNFI